MQTFALQNSFCKNAADCLVIDYRCKAIEDFYKPFSVHNAKAASMIKQIILGFYDYRNRKKKREKINSFIEENIKLYKVASDDLFELNDSFDVFVTGSDQVFNPEITGNEAAYYLAFSRKARFSYAASFGKNSIPKASIDLVKKELEKFTRISVREIDGVLLTKELIGKDAQVNIDPTMLLSGEEWRLLELPPKKIKMPYILLYNMLTSEYLFDIADQLCQKLNIKVIVVNYKSHRLRNKYKRFNYFESLSPQEFLWVIDHASYVLTSSFHGTVFSILFHKQFLDILPTNEPRNIRITNLLEIVGLSERYYLSGDVLNAIEKDIDWKSVESILEMNRTESLNYIKEIVAHGSLSD